MVWRSSWPGLVVALLLVAAPVRAQEPWQGPISLDLGQDWTAHLGADVNVTGFSASQSAAHQHIGSTASVFANAKIDKLFANEWRVGVATMLDLYHDRYSGDNYGNRFFSKAYGFVHTPYGELQVGQQDGAAYTMAITGPLIAPEVAIDDANITFFADPRTGVGLRDVFDIRSAVFSTANDSKLTYFSPRLFGVQLGLSFTPALVSGPIPFTRTAPDLAGRQTELVEGALNYTGYFGRTSLGLYGGIVHGQLAHKLAGRSDLIDWAVGGELDYMLSNNLTAAIGGAYRHSNTYGFDPFSAARHGTSDAVHASATLVSGPYKAGLEYSDGSAGAALGLPHAHLEGYEISGAYVVNRNLQLTLGFQHERLVRSGAVFYSGSNGLGLNAVFLFAKLHV